MDLTAERLKEAIAIRKLIVALERQLEALFARRGPPRSVPPEALMGASALLKKSGKRKSMSAATRAKLRSAASARWANRKQIQGVSDTHKPPPRRARA